MWRIPTVVLCVAVSVTMIVHAQQLNGALHATHALAWMTDAELDSVEAPHVTYLSASTLLIRALGMPSSKVDQFMQEAHGARKLPGAPLRIGLIGLSGDVLHIVSERSWNNQTQILCGSRELCWILTNTKLLSLSAKGEILAQRGAAGEAVWVNTPDGGFDADLFVDYWKAFLLPGADEGVLCHVRRSRESICEWLSVDHLKTQRQLTLKEGQEPVAATSRIVVTQDRRDGHLRGVDEAGGEVNLSSERPYRVVAVDDSTLVAAYASERIDVVRTNGTVVAHLSIDSTVQRIEVSLDHRIVAIVTPGRIEAGAGERYRVRIVDAKTASIMKEVDVSPCAQAADAEPSTWGRTSIALSPDGTQLAAVCGKTVTFTTISAKEAAR